MDQISRPQISVQCKGTFESSKVIRKMSKYSNISRIIIVSATNICISLLSATNCLPLYQYCVNHHAQPPSQKFPEAQLPTCRRSHCDPGNGSPDDSPGRCAEQEGRKIEKIHRKPMPKISLGMKSLHVTKCVASLVQLISAIAGTLMYPCLGVLGRLRAISSIQIQQSGFRIRGPKMVGSDGTLKLQRVQGSRSIREKTCTK